MADVEQIAEFSYRSDGCFCNFCRCGFRDGLRFPEPDDSNLHTVINTFASWAKKNGMC